MVSTLELPVFRFAELVNKYTFSTRFFKKRPHSFPNSSLRRSQTRTPQALYAKKCKHRNTHLTGILKRTARRIPFHHHWYLSSTFFMVLTLKCKQALWLSLKLVLPTGSCYSTTAVVVETLSGSEEINLAYAVLPSTPARMIVIANQALRGCIFYFYFLRKQIELRYFSCERWISYDFFAQASS